jgi:hypothetical protein
LGYVMMVHFSLVAIDEKSDKGNSGKTAKSSLSLTAPNSAQGESPSAEVALGQIKPKAPSRPVTPVNSVGPSEQYKITEWNAVNFSAGVIDAIAVDGVTQPHARSITIKPDSVITLSGWAGHGQFGMRIEQVLISVCDRIVGISDVTGERADIAKAVHMNLTKAGWRATITAAHFPTCEQPSMFVWALAPIGFNIFPLRGGRLLDILPPKPLKKNVTTHPNANLNFQSAAPLSHPKTREAPAEVVFEISATVLRIRQCPDVKCRVVGKFKKGSHRGFILEVTSNWILMQSGKRAGWMYLPFVNIRQ